MGLVPQLSVVLALLVAVASAQSTSPPPYTNHTVAQSAGWFFNATTETPSANYSAWAQSLTFNLGDYLIFNTNSNHTVVQTYNETSYRNCDIGDDDSDEDVAVYAGEQGFGQPTVLAVPLTKVGPNYFFSGVDDGDECEHGMKFEITVNQGRGLPPSLNQPPPPPYKDPSQSPPASPSGNGAGVGQGETATNGCPRVRFAPPVLVGFLHLFVSLFFLL
ncbi:early nodulin-like protein 18 [Aristolochia californica]|uniref:early nodulin-like protein 18 n=1 Tax=Aristolochia californica TaxID=171875 RepID=UPI0035DC6F72